MEPGDKSTDTVGTSDEIERGPWAARLGVSQERWPPTMVLRMIGWLLAPALLGSSAAVRRDKTQDCPPHARGSRLVFCTFNSYK
jgi:hypothetical protein